MSTEKYESAVTSATTALKAAMGGGYVVEALTLTVTKVEAVPPAWGRKTAEPLYQRPTAKPGLCWVRFEPSTASIETLEAVGYHNRYEWTRIGWQESPPYEATVAEAAPEVAGAIKALDEAREALRQARRKVTVEVLAAEVNRRTP